MVVSRQHIVALALCCLQSSAFRTTLHKDNRISTFNYSAAAQILKDRQEFIPDLNHPDRETLNQIAPRSSFRKYWKTFVKAITPASASALATTIAKLVVWGVGNALTIAFPPAALAIAGGVALAAFLISAASLIAKDGGLRTLASGSGLCELMQEVTQNMLVGVTGGFGATIPAMILSADALEMVVTEYKSVPGLALQLHTCPGSGDMDYMAALEEIRQKRSQTADDLLKALPWGPDPTMGGCHCDDCGEAGIPWQYCKDDLCIPKYFHRCEREHATCTIVQDCFKGSETDMRLAHPELMKWD